MFGLLMLLYILYSVWLIARILEILLTGMWVLYQKQRKQRLVNYSHDPQVQRYLEVMDQDVGLWTISAGSGVRHRARLGTYKLCSI